MRDPTGDCDTGAIDFLVDLSVRPRVMREAGWDIARGGLSSMISGRTGGGDGAREGAMDRETCDEVAASCAS